MRCKGITWADIGSEKDLAVGQEALPLVKQAFAFGCKGVKRAILLAKKVRPLEKITILKLRKALPLI